MTEQIIYTNEILENIRRNHNCECYKTGGELCKLNKAEMYEHDGGDFVEGKDKKQWIYFTCKKCGYEWVLWKVLQRINKFGDNPDA
ncbi:MAG: hypothetical protein AABY22_09890 [Nanoarchaeota archaeon]